MQQPHTRFKCLSPVAALLIVATLSFHARADFRFEEVSGLIGIQNFLEAPGLATGAAAADFDDDGDIDLFIPTAAGTPNQLYENLGNGGFQEMAFQANLANFEVSRSALWFDFDGDHKLDLVVAGDCYRDEDPTCQTTLRFHRQIDNKTFSEVTESTGIITTHNSEVINHFGGLSAADINNDGYLDLFLVDWKNLVKVFLNNTDGTFQDISLDSQIGIYSEETWQLVLHDFDRDGWFDIYAARDFAAGNQLWINQQDNTFVDNAETVGVKHGEDGMGITFGDYDNDGDFDIFLSTRTPNRLFRNDSTETTLSFQNVEEEAGVSRAGWAWGCSFFDADNDGLLDLAVTNGVTAGLDQSKFFLNQGGNPIIFDDRSEQVNFDDTLVASALLAFDFNRDGHMDLLQATHDYPRHELAAKIRILENRPDDLTAANNYLVVKPRIPGPNHRAIGAVIRLQIGDTTLSRLITAGTSTISQEPAEAHFGIGTANHVDALTIEWPDGDISHFDIDAVNKVYIADKTIITPANPQITLIGGDTITAECNQEFIDPGATATDDFDGDLTNNIQIGGDRVDTNTPGQYQITYNLTDSAGLTATTRTRTVTVQDTTPPDLFIEEPPFVEVEPYAVYTDPGATATDACDGDRTENIITEGLPIDTATPGEYTVTYTVNDNAGNAATPMQRTVRVNTNDIPIITLNGGDITLECGQPFIDPGATADDTEDGNITENILARGTEALDAAPPGIYTITYDVVDESGNSATQVLRLVMVEDATPPAISHPEGNLILECDATFIDPGAQATDTCDGNLTGSIVLGGDTVEDTNQQRVYRLTYMTTDSAGNTASTSRTVTANCLPEGAPAHRIASTLLGNLVEFDGDGDGFLGLAEVAVAIPGLSNQQFYEMDADADGLLTEEELSSIAKPKLLGCYAVAESINAGTAWSDFALIILMLLALINRTAIAKHTREDQAR